MENREIKEKKIKDRRVINELFRRLKEYFNPANIDLREGIRRVLLLVCIVAFIVSGYTVVQKWYIDYVTQKKYENIKMPSGETGNDDGMFDPTQEDPNHFAYVDRTKAPSTDYIPYQQEEKTGNKLTGSGRVIGAGYLDVLENRNADVIGYIRIPDTIIDYYVLQYRLDNDYYLHRDIDLKKVTAASVFMDYRNRPYSEDLNTVLYGHNMKNGTMFANLHKYKDKEFAMSHTYIYFDTLYEEMVWEVFATYKSNVSFDYIQTSFRKDKDYEDFLKECKSKSLYKFAASPGVHDRILTLSTCDKRDEDRYVVQAMLVSRTKK